LKGQHFNYSSAEQEKTSVICSNLDKKRTRESPKRDPVGLPGDPAPNAPKWFAAVEMIRLATDQDWLHKTTKEIAKFWRNKRER
jgi:hypothetical protein